MIIEVRTYTIKPGLRDQFIALFERRAILEQQAVGIKVLGPLLDTENPNVFLFLRAFPSLEERDRMTSLFYDGPVWKNELERLAMPMIETYSAVLTVTTPGFVTF
jgi:hypothetical protein